MSGYVDLTVCSTASAENVQNALLEWFKRLGISKTWVSDRGSHFKNQVMEKIECSWSHSTILQLHMSLGQWDSIGCKQGDSPVYQVHNERKKAAHARVDQNYSHGTVSFEWNASSTILPRGYVGSFFFRAPTPSYNLYPTPEPLQPETLP